MLEKNNTVSNSVKLLTDHMPTLQGNPDIVGLQVVGTSVLENEKAHVMKLINGTKLGDKEDNEAKPDKSTYPD